MKPCAQEGVLFDMVFSFQVEMAGPTQTMTMRVVLLLAVVSPRFSVRTMGVVLSVRLFANLFETHSNICLCS